jgi:hypothetical protein
MQPNPQVAIIMVLVSLLTTSCASPIQTSTPIPTTVLTNTPHIVLGELIKAEKGGFAYKPILGYKVRDSSDFAMMSNDKEKVIINLVSTPSKDNKITNIMDLALVSFGLTQINESEKYNLNGVDGIKVEVKTDAFFEGATGEVIILIPDENRYFTAIAIAGDSGMGWNPAGKKLFDDVLNNLVFFEPPK